MLRDIYLLLNEYLNDVLLFKRGNFMDQQGEGLIDAQTMREFHLPVQQRLLEEYINLQGEGFKRAFIEQDINTLCRIIESKHIRYLSHDGFSVEKQTHLSLDWLNDPDLYYYLLAEKNHSELFAKQLIVYLAGFYVLLSSKDWQTDRGLSDIQPSNIKNVLNAFNRVIEYNQQEDLGDTNFQQNKCFFLEHIEQLQLIKSDVQSIQSSSKMRDEKDSVVQSGKMLLKEDLISPLPTPRNSSISNEVYGAPILSSPMARFTENKSKQSGVVSEPSSLQEIAWEVQMNLKDKKQALKDILIDYTTLVQQRVAKDSKETMYSWGLKVTDQNKINKANVLLALIDSTDKQQDIESKIDEYSQELSKQDSYLYPVKYSEFFKALRKMKQEISSFNKPQVLDEGTLDAIEDTERNTMGLSIAHS